MNGSDLSAILHRVSYDTRCERRQPVGIDCAGVHGEYGRRVGTRARHQGEPWFRETGIR